MEPDNPVLDDFVLGARARRASRGSSSCRPPRATRRRRSPPSTRASRERACVAAHLSLFRLHGIAPAAARGRARAGRRSTSAAARCATCWRSGARTGSTRCSREAWERGIVLAGLSAGAMCWFEGGDHALERAARDDRRARAAARLADRARRRRARAAAGRTSTAVRSGALPGGWAADDGVGLLFEGTRLARVGLLAAGRGGAARRRGRRRAGAPRGSSPSCSAPARPACRCPATPSRSCARVRRLRGRPARRSAPRTGRVRARSHRKGAQVR